MNYDEIQQLTHIRMAHDASKQIYRYDISVHYYHPRCILITEMLLIDYRNTYKYCVEHIANNEINTHPELKFIVPSDLKRFNSSNDVILHDLATLTVQQAQEIINANIVAIQDLQTKLEEHKLIKQIESI